MVGMSRRTAIGTGLSLTALGAVGFGLWPRLDGYHEEVERQRRLPPADAAFSELVRMATLAANGHNTQPWKFRLDEQRITILPDLTRRTEVVDPDDHHLYVSLGCATENLVIAAAAHGHASAVEIQSAVRPQIAIDLSSGVPTPGPLYQAIPLRQSTRSAYDGRAISSEDMRLLEDAAQEDGVSVLFFTSDADLDAITEFVVAGNSAQMDDPAFLRELRDWLRFSPARAIESGDGLFAATSGNPVVPEWMGGTLFDMVFSKEAENKKYTDHMRSSAGVAVFVGERDAAESWIKVGRCFERFALQATALGIRNAHLNQPIEDLATRPEFARWLGMPDRRPDLVVRFGRAPALPMSPRRPVSAVLL